jgi:hypothetical protein
MPNQVIRPAMEVIWENQVKTLPAPAETAMKARRAKREQRMTET